MPYIPKSQRNKINQASHGVLDNAGALNYTLHQLVHEYLDQNKITYQSLNDVIGVLECAKQEIYRRIASDYEDRKILQNGDCEPYQGWFNNDT